MHDCQSLPEQCSLSTSLTQGVRDDSSIKASVSSYCIFHAIILAPSSLFFCLTAGTIVITEPLEQHHVSVESSI